MRGLDRVQRNWERLGAQDSLWAVLSDPDKAGGRWDREAFFADGRRHIDTLMAELDGRDLCPPRGRALDFGCGVGRLSLALTAHFDAVDGVDVSEPMLGQARELHQVDGLAFHLNQAPDLSLFADDQFDLVVTFLVLQHLPPELSLGYISEFVRVLRPGGLAVFQVPESLRRTAAVTDGRFLGAPLRNLAVRAKGVLLRKPVMEMHMVSRAEVTTAVVAAGGVLLEAEPDGSGGEFCHSTRYLALAPPR
ncbi:hypothetical protein BH20ACT2_BH20ACT2_18140 [soil metagenome]